ncbi:MAG: 6-bladed beta-propeller [Candidatus Krumholzibacteriia bacterium]
MLQVRMHRPLTASRGARPFWFQMPMLLAAVVLLAVLAMSTSPSAAGSWKGQEVTKEGVLHIMNPAEGMEASTSVELTELWRLGGDTEDEEEFFGVIAQIKTDPRGNLYVLDSQLSEVKIYDANGEYLNSIGREGEGPGEFRRPNDMFFMPDGDIGVMQSIPGKIVTLTPEGDPAGDFPLPTPEGGGFQMLRGGRTADNHLVLARQLQAFEEGKVSQTISLDKVDMEGNIEHTYLTNERVLDFANFVIDEKRFFTFEQQGRWDVGKDGRVYVLNDYVDYVITVYNADGSLDRKIRREYEHRKRTAKEIETIEKIWEAFLRQAPNAKTDIGDLDYDVQAIYPRDDGSLWVLTSYGARDLPDGVLGVFDVFDDQGHYVRQVTLEGQGDPQEDGYFFVGDRLYVVTGWLDAVVAQQGGTEGAEEEEEAMPMELICYRVDAPVIAKGE